MAHFDVATFLNAAIGLLGIQSLCLLIFGRLGIGSIVAFLIAGIVVGQIRDIPPDTVTAVREFAELGVVLLLFLIGLEITPPQLHRLGRDAALLGGPQILLSAAAIAIYLWLTAVAWNTAIVLGLGFSLSSTIVVLQLLGERGELQSSWGQKAFAILLAQDLAIVPFLLVISLMVKGTSGGDAAPPWLWTIIRGAVVVAAVVLVGRLVLTRVLAAAIKQQNEPALVTVTFLGVLIAALGAQKAGLSMALGTFLLGLTLSLSPFGHRIASIIEPVKSTLLALFFLSVGLSVDLQTVAQYWLTLLVNTLLILAGKAAIILLLGMICRLAFVDALKLSFALAQCGEFGFVLFAAAQAGGLLTGELAALASVLITISMLATPFLIRLGGHLAGLGAAPGGVVGD